MINTPYKLNVAKFLKSMAVLACTSLLIFLSTPAAQALSQDQRNQFKADIDNFDVGFGEITCPTDERGDAPDVGSNPSLESFIDTYGQMAFDSSISTAVPYEFTLAQAMHESGYGASRLTTEANNFFGIKAGSSWTGATITMRTREVVNGSDVYVDAQFRAYPSAQEGFSDHANFLRTNSRYHGAFQYSHDPYRFLDEVFAAGYATDPNYVSLVSDIIAQTEEYIRSTGAWPPSSQVEYTAPPIGSPADTEGSGGSGECANHTSGEIIGDPYTDSSDVDCDENTTDLGVHTAYVGGEQFRARLCSLPNLPSSGQSDNAGSTYSTPGADGHAIVNSRVSGAWFRLVEDARAEGVDLAAGSSFRSMPHQEALWADSGGDSSRVARPGYSSHQAGVAIDFSGISGYIAGASCSNRAADSSNPDYTWLRENANRYGFMQYAAEAWHWDALPEANRC